MHKYQAVRLIREWEVNWKTSKLRRLLCAKEESVSCTKKTNQKQTYDLEKDDERRDNEEVRRPEQSANLSFAGFEPDEGMTFDSLSTIDSSKDGELNWINDTEWQKWSIGRRLLHRFNFTTKHQWPDPKSWESMNAEEKRAFKVKRSLWWNKAASNWDRRTKKTAKFWSDKVLFKKEIFRLRKNRFIKRCDPNNYKNPLEEEKEDTKLKLTKLIEEKEKLCKEKKKALEEERKKLEDKIGTLNQDISLVMKKFGEEQSEEEMTMMRLFGEFNQLRNYRTLNKRPRYENDEDDYDDYEGDVDLEEAEKMAEKARMDYEDKKKKGIDPHSSDYDY